MDIYCDNGYLDIRKILNLNLPFVFIVGGRGTGKTFGALEVVIEDNLTFMFMRRTQAQADIINKPEFNPFKSLNNEFGWNIGTRSISKYNSGFYEQEEKEGKLQCVGNPLGYTCALSTVSNVRGFDGSDIDVLIYDEFIPEKHERPIKNEGSALLNAYETINRNRELKGQQPLQMVCMANANSLANPIFMELKIVRKAEQMMKKGQEIMIDRNRGIVLIILQESEISFKKKDTVLYRLTDGTQFSEMSIKNEFSNDEFGKVKSQPLKEYRPIVNIGEICIYRHKSNGVYYVSTHVLGSPKIFGDSEVEKSRFKRIYYWLWEEYLKNNIIFEECLCEILLTKYFS